MSELNYSIADADYHQIDAAVAADRRDGSGQRVMVSDESPWCRCDPQPEDWCCRRCHRMKRLSRETLDRMQQNTNKLLKRQ